MTTEIEVQRFQPGHPLYSDAELNNTNAAKGLIGKFKATFGQLLINGVFICYTMERSDTLISGGRRRYKLYFSLKNKMIVLLFEDEPESGTYNRKFEFHIANWPSQLEGCTAGGMSIDLKTPALLSSKTALDKVKALAGTEGFITHETLKTK